MSDAETRQKAEDHYYAALDLMGDGKLEEAVAAYRESLAGRSNVYGNHARAGAGPAGSAAL